VRCLCQCLDGRRDTGGDMLAQSDAGHLLSIALPRRGDERQT
jgi:hypothetical protein